MIFILGQGAFRYRRKQINKTATKNDEVIFISIQKKIQIDIF